MTHIVTVYRREGKAPLKIWMDTSGTILGSQKCKPCAMVINTASSNFPHTWKETFFECFTYF